MLSFEHGGDVFAIGENLLDFSVNISPLGMSEAVKAAMEYRLEDESYPDPYCRKLSAALARREGLKEQDIFCGSGASELIFRLCLALRPKRTLLAVPCFSEYEKAARLSGSEISYYFLPEDKGFFLGEGFLNAITPGMDLVFLANPNNPTGRLPDWPMLEAAARRCGEVGAVLAVDECFLAFTGGRSCRELLDVCPHLVVLNAFTKSHAMAGLRLGYLLTKNHELLTAVREAGPCWSVSSLAQRAGLAALEEEKCLEGLRRYNAVERPWMAEKMLELGLRVYEGEANFILFFGPDHLKQSLITRGILIRDCSNFRGLGPGYWRTAVKSHPENEQLIQALKEVLHG